LESALVQKLRKLLAFAPQYATQQFNGSINIQNLGKAEVKEGKQQTKSPPKKVA